MYRALVESGSTPADPVCLTWTTWDTLQSPQPPPPNHAFFYLVAAENICGATFLGPGTGRSPEILCEPPPDDDFDFDSVPDLADNCAQWPNQAQTGQRPGLRG